MRAVQKLLFAGLMVSLVWIALCTSIYAQLADSPWPMYGHDPRHTGRSSYSGPETPGTKWKVETGDRIDSSPAIGLDGTIYVGSWDHHLYAIGSDGTLEWKYETRGEVRCSPAIGADGTVYVTSQDHYLYAIHSDGALKWKYEYEKGDIKWSSPSSPVIGSDGTIYVGSGDNHVHAIHPDGSVKWKYEIMNASWSCPAIGLDGTIYVGSEDRSFHAINPDGSSNWQHRTKYGFANSPAIGSDETVYIVLPLAVEAEDVDSGLMHLYAFNPDGTVRWKCATVIYRRSGANVGCMSSPAIGADGTIYVGSVDKRLYAIDPNGTLKWAYETEGKIWTCPAIGSDGIIYVGSEDERLYAINPDGSLKWKYRTGDRIFSSVAIGPNSTLYVGSHDRNLYAIYVGNEQEVEVIPTTDLVIYDEGPGDGCTIKASSKADSDPYATKVAHSGDNAHAITIQRPGERIPGKVTYTLAEPDGVVRSWYTHLSFWVHPGDADIQKLVLDVGGRIDKNGDLVPIKLDLVGDMGLELSGGRWIEVQIPLEGLCGESERMPFLVFGGTVTGTFYVDDVRLELAEPTAVEVSEGMALPAGYALSRNHPNPFNPETTISYDVAEANTVRLSIYALTGQRVRTLVDGYHSAGAHTVTWDGTDAAGRPVASGVYLCRMQAGDFRAVRKMLLIR